MARRGGRRTKSEYGIQLAEKQKIRKEYGLRERQFRSYFDKGKEPGSVFALLESRLDSVIYRTGFATTRHQARQLASHGHITLNGRRVTIPSIQVRVGDVIAVREQSREKKVFEEFDLRMKKFETPSWLTLDVKKREAIAKARPDMKEAEQPFNFQTVIEFYSR